ARNSRAAGNALRTLESAAAGSGNLMPPILAAVTAEATLGEISGALRTVFGRHVPPRR
ncbi:MAG: methylmalonyl-CoA mutase, partial [Candidatus Brocadiae bacterium]|nr:methylmalonyl-CoA mutase [Candidatus Brocadiia bacterium]